MTPAISIIIVSFNTKDITLSCIKSIFDHSPKGLFEVIVVDNNSTDRSADTITKKFPQVKIIKNKTNVGFGSANNQGTKMARGKFLLFLNSDTQFIEDSLSIVLKWASSRSSPFILGCKLLNPDRSLQYSAGFFPSLTKVFAWTLFIDDLPLIKLFFPSYHLEHPNFYSQELKVDWVMGAFIFTTREFFTKSGGFDENMFMYGEEIEWQMRAKNMGASIRFSPATSVIHLGRASSNKVSPALSITGEFNGILYIYQKHYSRISYWLVSVALKLGIFLRMIIFDHTRKGVYREALAKI